MFRCSDPLPRHLTEAKRRMRTVSNWKSATFFLATQSVNSAPFKRGERGANFWQGKVQISSPILIKVHIFGKETCETHRQFQRYFRGRHFRLTLSLSLYLSLSPSAPHAQYRKRFRASYNKPARPLMSPVESRYGHKTNHGHRRVFSFDFPTHVLAERSEARLPNFDPAFVVNHTLRTDLFVKVGS